MTVRDAREFDVVVAGGGPAGVSAAISSARLGLKTLLIEEDAVPGGAAVDQGVLGFCGEPVEGIHRELRERLAQIDPCYRETEVSFWPWNLVRTIHELLAGSKVELLTGTKVTGALVTDNAVRGVRVSSPSRSEPGSTREVAAKVVVDATGNGDVAALAGCEFRFGRDSASDFNEPCAPQVADHSVQNLTWMYVCQDTTGRNRQPNPDCFTEDYYRGNALHERWMHRDTWLIWNGSFPCKDPLDPDHLEATQRKASEALYEQFDMLEREGFAIVYVAPRIGIREARRIMGEHILTMKDIVECRSFDDVICYGRWGLDLWHSDEEHGQAGSQDWVHVEKPYQIPYRCLVPKRIDGLLLSGRCISGSHIAHSSYRVMTIAALLGQAAGVAAGLSAKHRIAPRKLNAAHIQKELARTGLVLRR